MTEGGSILTLTYYGSTKVFPNYNVMGVAKAGLEATVRYLAASLGSKNIRVNAISAGPIKTLPARGIGDFSKILDAVTERAPLHRNLDQLEGYRAVQVSTIPRLGIPILTTDVLDMAVQKFPPMVFESREKLLSDFDTLAAEARDILASATDEHLKKHWKLAWGDRTFADAPRSTLYRSMFFNHLIHHRAQLGVYLRLNDVPLPPPYGHSTHYTIDFY